MPRNCNPHNGRPSGGAPVHRPFAATMPTHDAQTRRPRHWRTAMVAVLALMLLPVTWVPARAADGGHGRDKFDSHVLAVLAQNGPAQKVIVQTAPGAGQAVADAARRKGRRAARIGTSADLLAMTLSAEELTALASRPEILRVSSDAVVESHGAVSTEVPTTNHLLNTLGLSSSPWNGAWVGVVVIDSGIAFSSNVSWAKSLGLHAD